MVYQAFKYITVRLGISVTLMMTVGFGVLFFVHEVAVGGAPMDDIVLEGSLFGASLLLGFVIFGWIGQWRFAMALRALQGSQVDDAEETIDPREQFQSLIRFTRSSYFWPGTGRRLRQRVIREYADYLLNTGAEDAAAQRIFLKAFLQNPNESRFRDVLVSVLTRKSDPPPREVDVLLLILTTEEFQDRPLLVYLADYFLRLGRLNHKSEPVFHKALEAETGNAKPILGLVTPVLLANNRVDARAVDFYLHALPHAAGEEKERLVELISRSYCENRFLTSDPILHEKCRQVFGQLDSARQEEISNRVELGSLQGKWKRVQLVNREDRRVLRRFLIRWGIIRPWKKLFQAGLKAGFRKLMLGFKSLGLWTLEGVSRFGRLAPTIKLKVMGIGVIVLVAAAVLIDWRLNLGVSQPTSKEAASVPQWTPPATPSKKAAANRRFTIQVAAVTSRAQANRFVRTLKRSRIKGAYILKVGRKKGGYWYKIRVGKFPSKNGAQAFANRLVQKKLIRNYFVIALPAKKA
ncbi:MAG: SPOR domain-containing protein [Nitrospinaceae bacterium]